MSNNDTHRKLEFNQDPRTKSVRIAGFYRVWTQDGKKTTDCQLEAIKVFNSQIDKATDNHNSVLVLGDANLCEENKKTLRQLVVWV